MTPLARDEYAGQYVGRAVHATAEKVPQLVVEGDTPGWQAPVHGELQVLEPPPV